MTGSTKNIAISFAVFVCCSGCSADNERQALQEIAAACGIPDMKIAAERRKGTLVLVERSVSMDISHPNYPKTGFPRQDAILSCVQPEAKKAGIKFYYDIGTFVD